MASGAANTSPTKRELADQFIPHRNSGTIPVTTPAAQLIRRSLPEDFVIRR